MHDDLIAAAAKERVSRKRVIRLMQDDGLKARVRKRYTVTTDSDHDQPIADNPPQQAFTAERPNQRWAGDTTQLVIGESGTLSLVVVLELLSRFVVGWAVSACNDRHLTIKALETAVKRRGPAIGLLFHSDQGCTYASEDYQRLLAGHGIRCRMSRRGNCYDTPSWRASSRRSRASSASGSPATARRRCSCSTTSRCSITNSVGIRQWVA